MSKSKYKMLTTSIEIAIDAHSNQFDRGGKPYILHPLHLMNQLMFDVELATIAVLHDVVEDRQYYSLSRLELLGFNDRIIDGIKLLTHNPEDSYEEYINDICMNYDAIRVKRKDLEHNSDITRLKGVTTKDLNRIGKYHRAFIKLGEAKRSKL